MHGLLIFQIAAVTIPLAPEGDALGTRSWRRFLDGFISYLPLWVTTSYPEPTLLLSCMDISFRVRSVSAVGATSTHRLVSAAPVM